MHRSAATISLTDVVERSAIQSAVAFLATSPSPAGAADDGPMYEPGGACWKGGIMDGIMYPDP